jgi:predicted enzyme related to lactoylglutathione lyase
VRNKKECKKMLQGLNFVMYHVPNLKEARDFYVEKLGLTVAVEQPGFIQLEQPGGSGATFALGEAADATPMQNAELWWFVADVDATHAALVAKGVEIASPLTDMPFGRTLAIKDPAGNTLYLLQPR